MRTETVSGLELIYPNYMVWDRDNNYVMLKVPAGRQAMLRVTIGGRVEEYTSEGDEVVLDISLLLRRNASYGAVSVQVYAATITPAFSVVRTYSIYLCKGRTLADRYHFSGRKIVLPYGTSAVDIPCAAACSISGGDSIASVAGASIKEYAISTSGVVTVSYENTIPQGYVNDGAAALEVNYEVEVCGCTPKDGAVVMWFDCDGCRRYLVGKVLNRGSSAESVDYQSARYGNDIATINSIVGREVTSAQWTLEIGVAQVGEAMHLEEMLISDGVYLIEPIKGDLIPIIPDFTDMVVSVKDIEDVVLKFKIQQ